jgi:hypothetical protein
VRFVHFIDHQDVLCLVRKEKPVAIPLQGGRGGALRLHVEIKLRGARGQSQMLGFRLGRRRDCEESEGERGEGGGLTSDPDVRL